MSETPTPGAETIFEYWPDVYVEVGPYSDVDVERLYSCNLCGALVRDGKQEKHAVWHVEHGI